MDNLNELVVLLLPELNSINMPDTRSLPKTTEADTQTIQAIFSILNRVKNF